MFKEVLKHEGHPHPAALRKPALRGDCIRYFDAFCRLGASRIWSQVGPQPITISEVESLMNMSGVEEPETRMKYLRLIQGMDRVELTFRQEKAKALAK